MTSFISAHLRVYQDRSGFGCSVSADNDTLAVGAYLQDFDRHAEAHVMTNQMLLTQDCLSTGLQFLEEESEATLYEDDELQHATTPDSLNDHPLTRIFSCDDASRNRLVVTTSGLPSHPMSCRGSSCRQRHQNFTISLPKYPNMTNLNPSPLYLVRDRWESGVSAHV